MADPLIINEPEGWGMATVMGRKSANAHVVGEALGIPLADTSVATVQGTLQAIGTGPNAWLLIGEGAGSDFAELLRDRLAGVASVSDQSSAYAVFRLSGPSARTVMQRGASIDFHPEVFKPGSVATTMIAHIGVIIWQVDDEPTYDVAVFRSLAGSFRDWLNLTVAAL